MLVLLIVAGNLRAELKIESNSLNILEKGNISEFFGDVRISGDAIEVKAEKAVFNEKTRIINAEGNVEFKYSSGTWRIEGRCGEIEIDELARKVFVWKNTETKFFSYDVHPVRKGSIGDPAEVSEISNVVNVSTTIIYSQKVFIDYSIQEAVFEGDVKVLRDKVSIFSDKAVYFKDTDKIVFTGSPLVVSIFEDGKIEHSADIINFYLKDEKVNLSGGAHTRVYIAE